MIATQTLQRKKGGRYILNKIRFYPSNLRHLRANNHQSKIINQK